MHLCKYENIHIDNIPIRLYVNTGKVLGSNYNGAFLQRYFSKVFPGIFHVLKKLFMAAIRNTVHQKYSI
jgi:hypothetical protein